MPPVKKQVHVACKDCANFVDSKCQAGFNPAPETTHLTVHFCGRYRRKEQRIETGKRP